MNGQVRRTVGLSLFWLLMAAWGWAGPAIGAGEAGPEFRPLVTAFHVHSTVSTGTLSLDELAERAERLGIEAIVLTDNFILRYEYGLFPLRGSIRHTFTLPSVLDYGLERYFADVAAAQARHPHVLLVPGVEVVPHYFWDGSLFTRNLTMHNSQKNMLVLGLAKPEDYATLPVNGNQASYHYGWNSLWDLAPVVLFIPAVWLWRRRTVRFVRVGPTKYQETTRRHRGYGVVLAVAGTLLLCNAWPFGQPLFSVYDAGLGYRPYQNFIEAVKIKGGTVIWSMPEAPDFNRYSYGPLGEVTVKTDPYPEALALTSGYTGFGGLYQQPRTVVQPGGIWDQVLGQALAGQGSAPPFAFGEIAFHTPGSAGIELDQVLTVFWVQHRTVEGLMDALRQGRAYATGPKLRLDSFQVESEGGQRRASSGETLDRRGTREATVRLSVTATDKGFHPISVTIIRSGLVVSKVAGMTPFEQEFLDETLSPGGGNFYRLLVEGAGEIVSNPVFIGPVLAKSDEEQPAAMIESQEPLNGPSPGTAEH